MAGSDDFQNRLNRAAQPTGTQGSSVSGDFSIQPVEGSQQAYTPGANQVGGSTGASGSFDYSMLDTAQDVDKPSSIQGPGSFGKQIEREKYLEDNDIAQGGGSADFVAKYAQMNKDLQGGDAGDGTSIADKYIRNAARTNPIDIQALDKHIRTSPLYHGAKSELEGLKTFGDMYRYGREQLPEFKMPAPMEGVKGPDFDKMYDKSRDDIEGIDI